MSEKKENIKMKRKEIKAVAFTLALFVASFTVGCAASQVEST